MSFEEQHAIETYKSLISISTEGFKALQLLNGGAVVAMLAYLGQLSSKCPELIYLAKLPLGLFVGGLVAGTFFFVTSYLTQLALHNENMGSVPHAGGGHRLWLCLSFVIGLSSVALFASGAFACLAAMANATCQTHA